MTRLALLVLGGIIDCLEAPVPIPAPSAEAIRYYHSGNILWLVATLWGLLLPATVFFTGFSACLRRWAGRLSRHWYPVLVIYVIALTVVLFAADLPLDYYADFRHNTSANGSMTKRSASALAASPALCCCGFPICC